MRYHRVEHTLEDRGIETLVLWGEYESCAIENPNDTILTADEVQIVINAMGILSPVHAINWLGANVMAEFVRCGGRYSFPKIGDHRKNLPSTYESLHVLFNSLRDDFQKYEQPIKIVPVSGRHRDKYYIYEMSIVE